MSLNHFKCHLNRNKYTAILTCGCCVIKVGPVLNARLRLREVNVVGVILVTITTACNASIEAGVFDMEWW